MRGKSHLYLAKYLASRYLSHIPKYHIRAFLFGCVQPDRNPVTYFKGSLHCQWLRGHNYPNARRYMGTLSQRLEAKNKLGVLDYYSLGKLIHYTADAFTWAHNSHFSAKLGDHRAYEAVLQDYFLAYLKTDPQVDFKNAHTIMDAIISCHREYRLREPGIHTDARFALNVCYSVLALLEAKGLLARS